MRAKILFLTDRAAYREDLRLAQAALSELAVAFSQSFSMREQVVDSSGALPDLAALAREHDTIILAGGQDFISQAAMNMGAFAAGAEINRQAVAPDLSRLKTGPAPALNLVWPLSDSPANITKTAVLACSMAKAAGRLAYINNGQGGNWADAMNQAAMYAALPAPRALSLDEALWGLLHAGETVPVLAAPPIEAAMLRHLLTYLGGSENIRHLSFYAEGRQFQAVTPAANRQSLPFFSLLYACALTVKQALQLEREGDCLLTAVSNVLASGWRTREFGEGEKAIPRDEALDLVAQQVRLAGELYEHLG